MSSRRQALLNGFFLLLTLIINTLGGVGLINGLNQKEISDRFSTLITPSPITFSIWGLIYGLLLVSIFIMVTRHEESYTRKVLQKISPLFIVTCLFNSAWIVAFSMLQLELSVFFILGLVVTLGFINQRLKELNDGQHWLFPLTFGLYAGWLIIATVVNVAATLVKIGWDGFGIADDKWAIIILIIALFIVLVVVLKTSNAVLPLPIAWAYYGIFQTLTSPSSLQTVTLVGMVVLIIIAVVQFIRNHFGILEKIPRSI